MHERNYLLEALAQGRTAQSWNDRLEHWERPASDSEEAMIERAATMVRNVMAENAWFRTESIQISPQGSYHNNTNVRQEADMDLRAVHRGIYIEYDPIVVREYAYSAGGYSDTGRSFAAIAGEMRAEIVGRLSARFGATHVDASGNKAIRLKALTGSRADVDIVPSFVLHHISWNHFASKFETASGVAILGRNGGVTLNYPEQHHANGIAKRSRTRMRFKKNVRMLKRLRDEMVELGILQKGGVPSFLVECLVYGVEDDHFLVEWDSRYERLRRVVARMDAQVNVAAWSSAAREINNVKPLFGPHQPWTLETAQRFTAAAQRRLAA
jgi:hypothetical protein